MPFNRPALSEIIDRTRNDVVSRLPDPEVLRRSDAEVYSRALAGASHGLYGYLDWLSRQLIYDTAETDLLERWGSIWGIARKAATAATGTVTFTGSNGAVVLAGTVLVAYDGQQYSTAANATISAGVAVATVNAVLAGVAGNRTTGQTFTLQSPVLGVNSSAVASAMTGGADIEDDDSLRSRLLARISATPHGGAKHDYEAWALEVAGVTRAWVFPQELGIGTVTVRFMMDDTYANGIPFSGDVTTVAAHIDPLRPVTAAVTVAAPVAVPLNFTVAGLNPSTAAVKAAITQELTDLIKREASPGGTIYLSHIREAISIAAGEVDHSLTSPSANVVMTTGNITTMGTVSYV
jgi:uncharacterized phage protein gp47/JayE